MTERRQHILFLGSGLNGLHLMAEGLARQHAGDGVSVVSGALTAETDDPLAGEVMREIGLEIGSLRPLGPEELEVFDFDLVVTLADFDAACRPSLPGMPPHFHWDVPLAPPEAPAEERWEALREARDLLAKKVALIFAADLLRGLSIARGNLEMVLDSLDHAVMAHTMNRRIFYFNPAAEEITGFRREEILGRDCHEVFHPGRFCGGSCQFCELGSAQHGRTKTTQVPFWRKDGEERVLGMAVRPLHDATGAEVGALCSFRDATELAELQQRAKHHHSLHGLVGRDPKMLALFEQIREVAGASVPVLIEGESGTGKELVARAIHKESPRAQGPFIPISCGALPEGILESELFGHVRGAFTGAVRDKRGRFELAHGGTLFLDEVGELSPLMQVKLLRVLQEHCFERVGGERTIQVDVRVVSATNQHIRRLMERGQFRRDLYYRLCVVPITPPPLRERRIDIPLLVDLFLGQHAKEHGRTPARPSLDALDLLTRYGWPGNVRELRNVVEYALVKCPSGVFGPQHLPKEIARAELDVLVRRKRGPKPKLDRARVARALADSDGNRSETARRLGVGRTTLYRFLAANGNQ